MIRSGVCGDFYTLFHFSLRLHHLRARSRPVGLTPSSHHHKKLLCSHVWSHRPRLLLSPLFIVLFFFCLLKSSLKDVLVIFSFGRRNKNILSRWSLLCSKTPETSSGLNSSFQVGVCCGLTAQVTYLSVRGHRQRISNTSRDCVSLLWYLGVASSSTDCYRLRT